jgi:hypothetical protein
MTPIHLTLAAVAALAAAGKLKKRGSRNATTSDAFRRWFGDSQVVDEQGEPLVVFHGTLGDFDTFEGGHRGDEHQWSKLGHWFSDSPRIAGYYAEPSRQDRARGMVGGSIMPLYLKIENPKRIDYDDLLDVDARGVERLRQEAIREGHDGFMVGRYRGEDGFDYVAFDSAQAKSATGNRGTFDPKDPRISYNRREP